MLITQAEWDRLIKSGLTKEELQGQGIRAKEGLCDGCYRDPCECIESNYGEDES